ncbi:hypothetical protein GCM10023350_42370 [Nocardioides endophyticus]|uniref:Htaa domain-containing protein n=1 Tax=Nocardioides endophyticus TaxID=1353775 RepID=A0ABP8ZCG3_9ACTN
MTQGTGGAATGLIWGIKASFLSYLARMPDLQSSVADGAVTTPANGFYFPLVSAAEYDAGTGLGTLRFGGDVRFSAHHGMLFVMFAQPWLELTAGTAVLSVADPASYPTLDKRVPLLDVEVRAWVRHGDARAWPALATTLRPEAVELFNDVYAAGEPFEPLDVRAVVDEPREGSA